MSQVPANAIAETVANLQQQNEAFNYQIQEFTNRIAANDATIAELEPLAVWTVTPEVDPVA